MGTPNYGTPFPERKRNTDFGDTNLRPEHRFNITVSERKRDHRFRNTIFLSPFYKTSGTFLREVERISFILKPIYELKIRVRREWRRRTSKKVSVR